MSSASQAGAGIWRVLAFAVVTGLAAGAAQAQSLADALAQAYRHSHLLDQQRALTRVQDENVAAAVAALRPTVTASLSSTATDNALVNSLTNTISLTASMTLWNGGSNKLAVEAARETVLATRQALVNAEISVLLNAATAYMDMIRDMESVRLAENNVRVLSEQLQATRDRFDVGEVTRTDVNSAESRLEAARAELALRQGTLDISRENYNLAVGHYPGSLSRPPALPRLPATLRDAKSIARSRHPSIRQAQHQVKAAEIAVTRAKKAMGPTLSGSATLSDTDGTAGRGASATLTLSQTLYAGGALSAVYYQAMAQAEANRAALLQTVHTVEQGVAAAWNQLAIARATITARQKQIRASRVALSGIREEANFGQRTTLDILNAEQELLQAEVNLAVARRDEYVAAYSLMAQMGLLTASYLKLGVKTYDPEDYSEKTASAPGMAKRSKMLDKVLKRAGRKP